MGVGYQLVNQTKQERVSFSHLPVDKKREIVGNPVAAALVTWYLLENQGDEIQFVSDTYDEWPFKSGPKGDVFNYSDQTEALISALITAGILQDNGIEYEDEDDPQNIYIRAIKNIWLDEE